MKKVVFTIVTKSYLWAARALVHQLEKYATDSCLYVCVVDCLSDTEEIEVGSATIIPGRRLVDKRTFDDLSFICSPFELCCVLRPFAHKYFFDEIGAQRVLFLDSDIYIASDVWAPFDSHIEDQIVLTKHISTECELKHSDILEGNLLRHGIYNGGILQLNIGDSTDSFLAWFESRLSGCFEHFDSCDQIWLNLVPVLFDGVGVVNNSGVNVGWWNFHERHISKASDDNFWVGSQPLHSLHLSHWSPANPEIMSCHYPELRGSDRWLELARDYAHLALLGGFYDSKETPYGFDFFHDGRPIDLSMRQAYKEILQDPGVVWDSSPFASSLYFYSKFKTRSKAKSNSLFSRLFRRG